MLIASSERFVNIYWVSADKVNVDVSKMSLLGPNNATCEESEERVSSVRSLRYVVPLNANALVPKIQRM